MAIDGGVSWNDLETRGFVHIPQFLSEGELETCRGDYCEQPVDASNRNYPLSLATDRCIGSIRGRLEEVLSAVRRHTSLKVDHIFGGGYFASKRGIVFPWHQDHNDFTNPNHFDYLNFYIPVEKPLRHKSNLSVVPFDVLERESPKTFRRVVARGASTTYELGARRGRQLVFQDENGASHLVRVNLDDLACTPELAAGDLLLIRGDVFHRTQDNDTDRVALSLRAANGQAVVRRAQLARGGLAKAARMAKNYRHYEALFQAFDEAGLDELPLVRLQAAAGRLQEGPSESGRFRTRLLKEKIRAGVVCSSVRIALSETIVRQIVARYHWYVMKRAHRAAGRNVVARTT